jgi:hypothetical protein
MQSSVGVVETPSFCTPLNEMKLFFRVIIVCFFKTALSKPFDCVLHLWEFLLQFN